MTGLKGGGGGGQERNEVVVYGLFEGDLEEGPAALLEGEPESAGESVAGTEMPNSIGV